jgi:predicted secreted protein
MSELAGRLMEIRINDTEMTDGGDGAKISGVDDATYNRMAEILEVTEFGDEYRSRIAGLKDTSVDLSGSYDPDDTDGQLELEPGDDVWVALFPKGTSEDGKQIKMIVENFEQSASVDGRQEFSSTLQGNGAPATISAA